MQFYRLAAAALFVSLPAVAYAAADSAPSSAQPSGEAQPAKPKKICRSETPTGSVRPRRVCRTVEQVAADETNAQRTREALNGGRSAP